jgi:Tfp pilus assembly protein PilX
MMMIKKLIKKYHTGVSRFRISEEKGAALAVAMIILVVLALLGSAAIKTSNIEVEIAGNEKLYQMAFYAANAGADLAPRVIRDTVSLRGDPTYGTEPDIQVKSGFVYELFGFQTGSNDGSTDTTEIDPDIRLGSTVSPAVDSVGIDIDRGPTVTSLPGGGIEFASGYEGIGGGASTSGLGILYNIESKSKGSRKSSSTIETRYLCVIGVGGGS